MVELEVADMNMESEMQKKMKHVCALLEAMDEAKTREDAEPIARKVFHAMDIDNDGVL